MPIEGIIAGLKEISEKYDLGTHNDFVKDAIEALTETDAELDRAYEAGKYDQLCEDFGDVIQELTKGAMIK